MHFLNVGCGYRYCKDNLWTNLDLQSPDKAVMAWNITQGLPYQDGLFDAVYHSHLFEHLSRADGMRFIEECFRVLRPGGILRVVVPDLEEICQSYLHILQRARSGDSLSQRRYCWIMLEMYDQAVRTESGGAMAEYLGKEGMQDKEFIISRIGSVGRDLLSKSTNTQAPYVETSKPRSLPKRCATVLTGTSPTLREALISRVLRKEDMRALKIGRFVLSGELHKWMYDSYSLGLVLVQAGFNDVQRCSPTQSKIPGWGKYFLDIDPDGFIHSPCSLYMEGIK